MKLVNKNSSNKKIYNKMKKDEDFVKIENLLNKVLLLPEKKTLIENIENLLTPNKKNLQKQKSIFYEKQINSSRENSPLLKNPSPLINKGKIPLIKVEIHKSEEEKNVILSEFDKLSFVDKIEKLKKFEELKEKIKNFEENETKFIINEKLEKNTSEKKTIIENLNLSIISNEDKNKREIIKEEKIDGNFTKNLRENSIEEKKIKTLNAEKNNKSQKILKLGNELILLEKNEINNKNKDFFSENNENLTKKNSDKIFNKIEEDFNSIKTISKNKKNNEKNEIINENFDKKELTEVLFKEKNLIKKKKSLEINIDIRKNKKILSLNKETFSKRKNEEKAIIFSKEIEIINSSKNEENFLSKFKNKSLPKIFDSTGKNIEKINSINENTNEILLKKKKRNNKQKYPFKSINDKYEIIDNDFSNEELSFEFLDKIYKKLHAIHEKCGLNCKHLEKFLHRIGFQKNIYFGKREIDINKIIIDKIPMDIF